MQPFLGWERPAYPRPTVTANRSHLDSAFQRNKKGPSRCRPGPSPDKPQLARSATDRAATALGVRHRARVLTVLLELALGLAADKGAGRGSGRGREVAVSVSELLADRAAYDGADGRAGDAVL